MKTRLTCCALLVVVVSLGLSTRSGRADGVARTACRVSSVSEEGGTSIWKRSQGTAFLRRIKNAPTCVVFEPGRVVATTATADQHQIIWDRIDKKQGLLFPTFREPITLLAPVDDPDLAATPAASLHLRSDVCENAEQVRCDAKDLTFNYDCKASSETTVGLTGWCTRE